MGSYSTGGYPRVLVWVYPWTRRGLPKEVKGEEDRVTIVETGLAEKEKEVEEKKMVHGGP